MPMRCYMAPYADRPPSSQLASTAPLRSRTIATGADTARHSSAQHTAQQSACCGVGNRHPAYTSLHHECSGRIEWGVCDDISLPILSHKVTPALLIIHLKGSHTFFDSQVRTSSCIT